MNISLVYVFRSNENHVSFTVLVKNSSQLDTYKQRRIAMISAIKEDDHHCFQKRSWEI